MTNKRQIKRLTIILLWMLSLYAHGQQILPGGVKGVSVWNITQKTDSTQAQWTSPLTLSKDTVARGKNKTLNNNPALCFESTMKAKAATVNLPSLSTFSFFTVCQGQDTATEHAVLSFENDTSVSVVLTDKRVAAVSAYKYANYKKKSTTLPRLYFYSQNTSKDSVALAHYLRIGQTPQSQSVPIEAFTGSIPEIILYTRLLSLKERTRIQTYLALKYGISLNQTIPVSYLNSRGEVIWDAQKLTTFGNNIAGIGRDDLSGLNQQKSESVQTPGVMTIEATQAMADNHFYIWGDNAEALRFKKTTEVPRTLERQWNLSVFGQQRQGVNIYTKVLSLEEIDPLAQGETYWMMIDRSGTGTWPFGKVSYVKCEPMTTANGTISFHWVTPDADSSGNDIFTLIAAPNLFTRNVLKSASCSAGSNGSISTEIVGGTAPYHLQLYSAGGATSLADALIAQKSYVFEDMTPGTYVLKVTDAYQQSMSQTLYLSNQHAWANPISESYDLIQGQTLTLDASAAMPAGNYQYTWINPEGTQSSGAVFSTRNKGTYQLLIADEQGCSYTIPFMVNQTGKSNFEKVELYPNPTTTGKFTIRMTLYRQVDVTLTVSTLEGQVLKRVILSDDSYYSYSDQLSAQGMYLVSLQSQGNTQTYKLIVQP